MNPSANPGPRPARGEDLDALVALEQRCFDSDRLSRRSFRHWIHADHGHLQLVETPDGLAGYVLVIHHRGTRLARLYSLAVAPEARGTGLGRRLVEEAERLAREAGRLYLRLEVRRDNAAAIALYQSLGYRQFGERRDYYEDHESALLFEKQVWQMPESACHLPVPWIRQSTPFTCGPACLLMAMGTLAPDRHRDEAEELQLWREATTIFMTSGHGGSHPLGLALAARARGFSVEVWINQPGPLFVEGVRAEDKKTVIRQVDEQFRRQATDAGIPVHDTDLTQNALITALEQGDVPLILISTWRLDRRRSPHWVVVSGYDERCFYIHDPDPDPDQTPVDCQYLPIDREEFGAMSAFGRSRLRTGLILRRRHKPFHLHSCGE